MYPLCSRAISLLCGTAANPDRHIRSQSSRTHAAFLHSSAVLLRRRSVQQWGCQEACGEPKKAPRSLGKQIFLHVISKSSIWLSNVPSKGKILLFFVSLAFRQAGLTGDALQHNSTVYQQNRKLHMSLLRRKRPKASKTGEGNKGPFHCNCSSIPSFNITSLLHLL